MALLSDDSEKWLREFIRDAISAGLSNHTAHIPEAVYDELSKKRWIDRARGNDGDCGWHGKVKLDTLSCARLNGSLNIYGMLRMLIANNSAKEEDGAVS